MLPVTSFVQRISAEGTLPTYRMAFADLSLAALATDFLTISASPTKTVKIRNIRIMGTAGTTQVPPVFMYKRTALNTGGTFTVGDPAKYDERDDNATAVVGYYTANPASLGTGKLLCSSHMGLSTVGGTSAALLPFDPEFGVKGDKPVILRPNSQDMLAVSWGGNTVFGSQLLHGCIVWTEE